MWEFTHCVQVSRAFMNLLRSIQAIPAEANGDSPGPFSPRIWVRTIPVVALGDPAQVSAYTDGAAGQPVGLSMPDGTSVIDNYDAAHRLTGVTDARGNSIAYTLDASGNRTQENVTDLNGALRRSMSRSFDALNRLQQLTGGAQ